MLKISLKEFALTRDFGPVKIGMPKRQVIELLGDPEVDVNFGTGYGGLAYGCYELFYSIETEKVTAIQNDHLEADCSNHGTMIQFKNEKFEVDTWFLEVGRDFTCAQALAILKAQKIAHTKRELKDFVHIKFESGVAMEFYNRSNSDQIIEKQKDYVLLAIAYNSECRC